MSNYTDIIAIHPYTTYRKGYFSNYSIYKRQIQFIMNMIKNSKLKEKPVFITEIGWSTSSTHKGLVTTLKKHTLTMRFVMHNTLAYQQL
jgi:exo-beta-1,3-glucanase (GH17 family)